MVAITVTKQRLRGRSSRQTIHLDTDGYHQLAVGAASVRTPNPINADFITLLSNTDCYMKFGDVTIDAVADQGFRLPANTPITFNWVYGEYLAVIQDSAAGKLQIVGAY